MIERVRVILHKNAANSNNKMKVFHESDLKQHLLRNVVYTYIAICLRI